MTNQPKTNHHIIEIHFIIVPLQFKSEQIFLCLNRL